MRRGRPSDLTPETSARILALLRAGNYRETAARGAGVHPTTLTRWLRRGRDESEGLYRDFRLAALEAEQHGEIAMLEVVVAAARTDAANARWYLERKHSCRWGKDTLQLRALEKDLAELRKQVTEVLGTPCN